MLHNETRRKGTSGGRSSPLKTPSWSIFNALYTLPYNLLGARLSFGLVSRRFMEFDLSENIEKGWGECGRSCPRGWKWTPKYKLIHSKARWVLKKWQRGSTDRFWRPLRDWNRDSEFIYLDFSSPFLTQERMSRIIPKSSWNTRMWVRRLIATHSTKSPRL